MRIVLATRNQGKLDELKAMLADLPVDLVSAADLGAPDVEEDRATLDENARKKAITLWLHTGQPSLADDTGLEVDALGGCPGVHSARFAGDAADDSANRARLLRELDSATDRSARFRTVLAFATTGGVQFFEGTVEGVITEEERGAGGFGYDSIFQPHGERLTFAEMSSKRKNATSHRRRALDAFAAYLLEQL